MTIRAVAVGRSASGLRFRQRGASLLFALSALVGLTLAGVAMMRTADTSTLVAGNIGFHEAAVQSSDLALETAVTTLSGLAASTASHSDVSASNYFASVGNTLDPPSSRLSTSTPNPIVDSATGNTLYYVIERMCNATGAPNTVACLMESSKTAVYRVTTLVVGPRSTSEVVQQYVAVGQFDMDCAVLTNSKMDFDGRVTITGTGDCIHSNTDVDFTRSKNSIVGTINVPPGGTITGTIPAGTSTNTNAEPILIPEIVPSRYQQYADYIFNADGTISQKNWATGAYTTLGPYLGSGTSCTSNWNGWCRVQGPPTVLWYKGDNSVAGAGMYFFDGNVKVGVGVGSSASPWVVSILASGSIEATQNNTFQNYRSTEASVPAGVKDMFLAAGGDIYLRGNQSSTIVPGAILSNEEVDIGGSSNFSGYIIARNSNNPDPAGIINLNTSFSCNYDNCFRGNHSINYQRGTIASVFDPLNRRQWRTAER